MEDAKTEPSTESNAATEESDDLVNLKDFISIKLVFEFQNHTAGSAILRDNEVALSEIRDRVLVFELPETSCNVEHNIMLRIGRREPGKDGDIKVIFQSTGKITRVKQLRDEKIRAVVTLVQFDEASWLDFIGLFARRQDEITEFLRQVKS